VTRNSGPVPLRLAIGATLALLASAPAGAGDTADTPLLEMVTVVGKLPQPLSEVAATVSVISAEAIERSMAQDVRDLVRFEPGLAVRYDPGRFGLDSISVRGLGGNRVLLETDGVPAASAFAVGNFANTGRAFADLQLIDRVEVLRGPASTLYGSDAIAGVIATTTRNPADLLGPGGDVALHAHGGYNGDDDSTVTGLTGAWRVGPLDTLLGWAHRSGHELDVNSPTVDANPRDYASDALLARAVYHGFARPLRLTASMDRSHGVTNVDSLELSGGRFVNTTYLLGDDTSKTLRVVLDQPLDGAGPIEQGEWRLYWQDVQQDQFTDEQRRAVPPRTPPLHIQRDFQYRERVVGAELTASRRLEAAGPHRVVAGMELSRSRIEELRDGLQKNLSDGSTTVTILGETFPVRDFPISDVTEAGLYLQDEWQPGAGRWTLIPAVRADWYDLEPQPDATYTEDNPKQQPVAVRQQSLSPKLGLTYAYAGGRTLFLQYSHGFRSPPFEDVNIGLELPQFNVRAIPNPGLEPEKSNSVEAGLRLSDGPVRGSASIYYSRYRDFIESKVNIGRDPLTGTTLFQSRNLAQAEIGGAELSMATALDALSPVLTGWSARMAVAWARGDDTIRDVPLNPIEPLRGVLGLAFEARSGRWGGELTTTAVAAKRRVDNSTVVQPHTPGYAVFDLTAHWRVNDALRVTAGVFNLADRSYWEWMDVQGRAADDPLLELYRRPGRSASVALTWEF
jgi:hemoglobin/transferrin/lactoferrin receptor protein